MTENKASIEITLGNLTIVRMDVPLNEDATILTGLELTVKGTLINAVGTRPADTTYKWKASAPIVVPSEKPS